MKKEELVGVLKKLKSSFDTIVLPMVPAYDHLPDRHVSTEEMFRQMRKEQQERMSNQGNPEDNEVSAALRNQGPISHLHP